MARLAMPDAHCRSVDVAGTRYEGVGVEPKSRAHEKALRDAGCFPVNLGGRTTAAGFPCPCGFASLFRRCSKCGRSN